MKSGLVDWLYISVLLFPGSFLLSLFTNLPILQHTAVILVLFLSGMLYARVRK